MSLSRRWKNTLTKVSLLLIGVFIWVPIQSYALDSSVVTSPTNLNPQNSAGGGTSCNYYFVDSYYGAVAPGSINTPPAILGTTPIATVAPVVAGGSTPTTLYFFNNVYNATSQAVKSNPTTQTPQVPCAGTYQLIFTIELQATTNVNAITVTPLVQDTAGTTLYPTAATPASSTIYPQCNATGTSGVIVYTTTPYCTVSSISGSMQVVLPLNDQVLAPSLTASATVNVVGGEFILFYLHS